MQEVKLRKRNSKYFFKIFSKKLPFVIIIAGIFWLAVAVFQNNVSGRYLWIVGGRHYAGERKRSEEVFHDFWIFNPRLQAVKVQVIPSCHGTVLSPQQPRIIPPFGWLKVSVRLNLTGVLESSCEEVYGIVVETPDSKTYLEEVRIRADICFPCPDSDQ